MQREITGATVAGVDGDYFNAGDGRPLGLLIRSGILDREPDPQRSSIGIGADGTLSIQRVDVAGFWQGRRERRRLVRVNEPPASDGGISVYTPSWGGSTPPAPGAVEAIVYPFDALSPGATASGTVVQFTRDGNTPIPRGGAVFSARGGTAQQLSAEAPPGSRITARIVLDPDWSVMPDALGGGPLLVRNGRPVFRAFEDFSPVQLGLRMPRTAIGQRRDGSIVLLAIDGGRPGYSVGATNFELAQALVRLGCVTGAGLDTGDSTTMAFDGQLLNRPTDRSGERAVAEGLFVFYYGVYAPPPSDPVLSPNGDGVSDHETLAFKTVAPSTVTATLVGPDGVPRVTQAGPRDAGTYTLTWAGTKSDGTPEAEGQWHWKVTAVDSQGRQSSADQTFWLNNTLGSLHATASAVVRPGHRFVVATFTVAHPARITATVETKRGVVLKTLVRGASYAVGAANVVWDGRIGKGRLAFPGRYVVHVHAENQFGPVDLEQTFTVRRG
jgi:hypothetical protein